MKNPIKTTVLVSALAAVSLPFSLNAQWNILADMEDQNLDNWFFSNRISVQPSNTDGHDGWNLVLDRPFDDQGGYVLAASEGTSWYNIYDCAISIGEMSETDDYTIYFEIAYNDDSSDIVVAVGDMKIPYVVGEGEAHGWSVEEPAWADWSILARFGRNGLDVRDINGTGYTEDYGEQQLLTWYQVWFVVHPTFYSWSMWIKGGVFTEQTQVADYHYFRKNDTDGVGPLRTLSVRLGGNSSSATTTGAPTYVDNVAVDTAGQNLTTPESQGGTGLKVNDWNLTDIGWVYGYSPNWGYSIFMGYVYMQGNWMYQASYGWMYFYGSFALEGGGLGIYFYDSDEGFIYTQDNYGGFFWIIGTNPAVWKNFLNPA
jgi:hypothetical protein